MAIDQLELDGGGMFGSIASDIKPVAYEAPALTPLTTGSRERIRIIDPIGSVGNTATSKEAAYRKIIEDRLKSLRYDATPAEIDQIVANSRYIKLDKESGVSNLEMGLSGEVSQFVNDNTLTYKDLNRIFTAELGRNPTVEERTEILGTSSTKVRIKGSEDLVF